MEQYDELSSLKREVKREEKARRRESRRLSRQGLPDAGLHTLSEAAEEEEDDVEAATSRSSNVSLQTSANISAALPENAITKDSGGGSSSEEEGEDAERTPSISAGALGAPPPPSSNQQHSADSVISRSDKSPHQSKRRKSSKHITSTPPPGRKASSASKSPRKVSLALKGKLKEKEPENGDSPDNEENGGTTSHPPSTRISVRMKRRLTTSSAGAVRFEGSLSTPPSSSTSCINRHTQTDIYSTEYGNILDKNTWLETDLQERKDTIASMEEHIFALNMEVQDLKMRLDEQVYKDNINNDTFFIADFCREKRRPSKSNMLGSGKLWQTKIRASTLPMQN